MAQQQRGLTDGTSSYSSSEMGRASRELNKAIAHGALRFLQTTFEIYPLEAVPNVWEGDGGMMEHVPPFPMPDFIALPVQPDAVAGGLTSRVHHRGRSRAELEAPEEHDEVGLKDRRQRVKKTGKDWKLLVSLAKVYESLNALSQCLIRIASRFTNHLVSVRKKAALQLAEVYGKMRKIKMCLYRAEVNYSKNGFSNLFQEMPLAQKIAFKKQNHLQGELPDSMRSVEEKFLVVRDKMGQIVRKNWEKLSPFKNILNRVMKDVHTRCNLFRAGIFQCLNGDDYYDVAGTEKHLVTDDDDAEGDILHSDGELDGREKSKKVKTENFCFTESSYVLSKEERFWENLMYVKIRLQRIARTLKVLGKVNVRSASVRIKCKKGSAICRQMLSARSNMMTLDETLVQLKKEMQTEKYEDKKLFTEEDLVRLGINGLTPDNSLAVAEAWLKKLQDEYLKIRGEKSAVLERFGYDVKIGLENLRIDKNMKLMRICEHSKCIIDTYRLDRVKTSLSNTDNHEVSPADLHNHGKTGDVGDQATSSLTADTANQHAETDSDYRSKNPFIREISTGGKDVNAGVSKSEDVSFSRDTEGGDRTPTDVADEHDASDESSPEDISKTVNTVSLFLSNFASAALSVNEERSKPASDDFTEKEKQYWDELQKLLRKVDKTVRQLTAKNKQLFFGQNHVKSVMQPIYFKLRGLLKAYELHNVEGRRCGYCRHVTYESAEQLPEGYDYILVKSLDQIKDRIDTAYGHYIATAKKVGMPFSYKL